MNNRAERPGTAIDLDAVALARVVLRRERMTQDERPGHREPPPAFLAWQRHGPQIAPRLLSVHPGVEVRHGVLVPPTDLIKDAGHVTGQPVLGEAEGLPERQGRLA